MKKFEKTAVWLLIAFAALSVYTFLHEGGHAVAALVQGGQLTAFSINFFNLSAHAGINGNFSPAGTAWVNLGGMALPLLVWLAGSAAAPRRASPVTELIKLMSTLIVLSTLLAWVAIPFFYLAGNPPPTDDVTLFIKHSGIPPLLLAGLALLVYLGGWVFYSRRSVGLRAAFALLSDPLPWDAALIRPAIIRICAVSALVWAVTFSLSLALPGETFRLPIARPTDYHPVAQVDLSQAEFQNRTLAGFTLTAPARPGIFVEVRDIHTPYLDLRLLGPDGFERVILHGEEYFTSADTAWLRPETDLPSGKYRVVLNSRPSPGQITVFLQAVSQ